METVLNRGRSEPAKRTWGTQLLGDAKRTSSGLRLQGGSRSSATVLPRHPTSAPHPLPRLQGLVHFRGAHAAVPQRRRAERMAGPFPRGPSAEYRCGWELPWAASRRTYPPKVLSLDVIAFKLEAGTSWKLPYCSRHLHFDLLTSLWWL